MVTNQYNATNTPSDRQTDEQKNETLIIVYILQLLNHNWQRKKFLNFSEMIVYV